MVLEQRHPQSQKSCKKAEIFVFVMVGLPHQGKSCEKAHNSQREQQNPTEGNEVNLVREMQARLDVLLPISQVS